MKSQLILCFKLVTRFALCYLGAAKVSWLVQISPGPIFDDSTHLVHGSKGLPN